MRIFATTIALLLAATSTVSAAPVVFSGADPFGIQTNTTQAFADWQAAVGGVFDQETMTTSGIAGGIVTTSSSNVFTPVNGGGNSSSLSLTTNSSGPAMDGDTLRLSIGTSGGFVWDFASPADSFGFHALDNDFGVITITFNDGSAQEYTFQGANSSSDTLFWGIVGVDMPIASVQILTTDPPGVSQWDNFVTANVGNVDPPVTPVPEPASLALWGLGAIGFAAYRRRKR